MLKRIWRQPARVKADYARTNAVYIGAAASLGLITTRTGPKEFSSLWHITKHGLEWLKEQE